MTDRATVDVLSLEDFQSTLTARLSEIDGVLSKLRNTVNTPPKLGTFADATACANAYVVRHEHYLGRAQQLKEALQATRDATETICANYRTTEARNNANAADIAAALGGVHEALGGNGRSDV
jgi:hypothetical protein